MTRVEPSSAVDRFRILFEQSSDAHLIFDETGTTDCNDACVKLLKATEKAQVLALHPAALSPEHQPDGRPSTEKSRDMDAIARTRGYHRFEWMHRKLNGEVFPVEVTLNPVEIGGKPAMIVVWHDLTEIKRVESELRLRSEELEALNGKLAATNARLKRDLEAAAKIQQALLPAMVPNTAPVQVAWTFRPCEELAGDLLNFFPLDDRRIAFFVLDVSGHGVTASLLSVTVSHLLTPHGDASLLRSPTGDGSLGGHARPAEALRRLNEQLCPDCSDQFLTLFYGILDRVSFTLQYANAGHPGPVVLRKGAEPLILANSSLPVGILEQAEYEDSEVILKPRDQFWLYSDGLVEAMNPAGEQFGRERFLRALQSDASLTLSDTVQMILQEAEKWTGDEGPQDDISLIAFEIGR